MYIGIILCLAATFFQVQGKPKSLNIKVAVVTGGAKGIGFAIADNYLNNGVETVIIVDINKPRGMKAERDLTCKYGANRTVYMYGDITKDLDRITTKIYKIYGYVDVLVCNAGVLDEKNPTKMMMTNALGTVLWNDKYYNLMRKDRGGKGGTIVNIASATAYYSDPFIYFYKSTKFAIVGITIGLGHEYNYMSSGVRIYGICPGLTRTDMTMKQRMVLEEQEEIFDKYRAVAIWQQPDAVGKAAVMLHRTAVTGMIYTAAGGEPPVPSPDRVNFTLDYFLSLK